MGSTSQNTSMKPRTNGCSAEATRSLPAALAVCTPHHSMKAGSGDVGDVCNVGGASSVSPVALDATGFAFSLRLVVDPMADCSARDSGEPVYTKGASPFETPPEGICGRELRSRRTRCKAAAVTQKNEPRRGEMDALPWHLQLKIFRGIGADVIRALGIGPGRLHVPTSLAGSFAQSLVHKSSGRMLGGSRFSWFAQVEIPIASTQKMYALRRRSDDGPIDVSVTLYDYNQPHDYPRSGTCSSIVLYRSDEPLEGYSWAELVRLR